jgi:16S rRNA G966 N2-methylase RsmD
MIHGERSNGKAHGVVNTKSEVVSKMLDLVGYISTNNLSEIKVLEPSAGLGAFAVEVLKRLYESSENFNFNFEESLQNIHLCELDEDIASQLIHNIQSYLNSKKIISTKKNIYVEDFLQLQLQDKYDLIIGNPPYVRNENIPEELKEIYQSKYSTFTHRSDLYIPFFEKALKHLNCEGQLSYVCSNRWLKNQYGINLRTLVASQYHVKSIIDLEQADIFDEDVLGYPAITTITNSSNSSNSPYSEVFDLKSFLEFEQNDNNSLQLNLKTPNWFSFKFNGYSFEKYLKKIEDQNYKIGIGVATGRDSIFIGSQFKNLIEDELLLPILTSKGVKSDNINWQGKYIINPFDKTGNLIKLDKYPLAESYFLSHKEELSKRHVAKKDQTKFYRTIDKINPNLLCQPKIILPDISGNRFIHVDKGDYYPHHNLYYIVGGSYEELCLLASILMSDFIYEQLLHIGNKMKGGYPRWQSQNIKKLRVPILNSIPFEIKELLMQAYFNKDLNKINSIVTTDTMETFEIAEGQGVLFEKQTKYLKINHDRITIDPMT